MGLFYLIVLVSSVGLLAVSLLLGELFEFGGEMGDWLHGIFSGGAGDLGMDVHVDGPSAPTPLSTRVLFAGAVGFGGGGWLATYAGASTLVAGLVSGVSFFAFAALCYYALLVPLYRMQGDSSYSRSAFVGTQATVTSAIPQDGPGQVQFAAPGTQALLVEPARSASGEWIPSGTTVRIESVSPTGVVVAPSNSVTK